MTRLLPKLVAEEVGGTFALIGAYAVAFSPSDITAMMVSLSALIAAVGTVIVNIITARRAAVKIEEVKVKTDAVMTEAVAIKGHVNSAAAAAAARIDALEKQIVSLISQAADSKERASLLAQALAVTTARPSADVPAPLTMGVELTDVHASTLKSIDVNTEQTAKNTAKTDAAVQELKEKP